MFGTTLLMSLVARRFCALVVCSFLSFGNAVAQAPPPLCLEQKLVASDAVAYDFAGSMVLISGDTAFVGVVQDDDGFPDSGAVNVYTRSGGVWSLHQKLIASDGMAGDRFGTRGAISGDILFIGTGGMPAVYVFTRVGGTWSEQQKVVPSASVPTLNPSLAVSGDTLVLGADDASHNGVNPGAAFVFTLVGGTWTEQQQLVASDGAHGDNFGSAVAISGDTLFVGARDHSPGGMMDAGAVYEFQRTGGVFMEQQKLVGDGPPSYYLGAELTMSTDTLVATASGPDNVVVFGLSGGTWTRQPVVASGTWTIIPKIALSGDTLIAGQYGAQQGGPGSGGPAFAGVVDVFVRNGGTWTVHEKIEAPAPEFYGIFGSSVSISGNSVLIGSSGDTLGGALPFAGAAYVYTSPPPCGSGACLDVAGNPGIGDSLSLSLQSPLANSPCYVLASTSVVPGGYSVNVGGASHLFHVGLGQPGVIPFADPSNTFGQSLSNPMTDANGLWCYAFEVPNDPVLVGVTFYAEAFVTSAAGSLVSNLESTTIQ